MTQPARSALPPALEVRDLEVGYGAQRVLRGLSLDVAAEERVAVVGASGAGKTTLLRAIAGFVRPSAGTVAVAGRDVGNLPPERRGAVYLHQTPVLFPHLDVFDNVAFPLRVRAVPEREVRGRVAALLRAMRLEDFGPRPPSSLSGGQRSRVALARAVVSRPPLLLLDEPLAALDPSLRDEVRDAIVALQDEHGVAAVLVTHDLEEAGLLGHRIGVLLDGTLAQLAPPAELFARPASLAVARFLGFPNEVRGAVVEDGSFESPLGRFPPGAGPKRAPGPAVAVFRAEAVRLDGDGAMGRVVRLLHRAHRASAIVRLGEAELEAAVDALGLPQPGAQVGVHVDPRRTSVFPAAAVDQRG